MPWQDSAKCKKLPKSIFYDEPEYKAKTICKTCIVKTKCLNFAIQNKELAGIWGGLNESERDIYRLRSFISEVKQAPSLPNNTYHVQLHQTDELHVLPFYTEDLHNHNQQALCYSTEESLSYSLNWPIDELLQWSELSPSLTYQKSLLDSYLDRLKNLRK